MNEEMTSSWFFGYMTTSDENIDDLLASFSPQNMGNFKEQRKAVRYRVKWQGIVDTYGGHKFQGEINDISTQGASIYLENTLPAIKSTLHIQVPPLTTTSKPHIISISGMIVYSVYEGAKQYYRIAINFLQFHPASEQTFLDERLSKHQIKIPELDNPMQKKQKY